jgi:hypothetical protein
MLAQRKGEQKKNWHSLKRELPELPESHVKQQEPEKVQTTVESSNTLVRSI